jgi:hypothetical protein
MDEYADFFYFCLICNLPYHPKIQGGLVMRVCPNCKNAEPDKQQLLAK